ncbi:MAG: hypothetical protein DRJ42_07265 [Deltaproteobacteria bacterium]|nr:MAG: hypothetical protein DRJ42_07265 [Deltaproteobacteria bacterium]
MTRIAYILDVLLLSFAFGTTLWFFFVQSPALFKSMGKERFLPLQMRLTKLLFKTLAVVVPLMLGATLVHGRDPYWLHVGTAGLATLGVLTNNFVVVPRALKAGGQSLRDLQNEQAPDGSVSGFASDGGGSATKVWHRMVVLFVVVMLAGLVSHGIVLMPG